MYGQSPPVPCTGSADRAGFAAPETSVLQVHFARNDGADFDGELVQQVLRQGAVHGQHGQRLLAVLIAGKPACRRC